MLDRPEPLEQQSVAKSKEQPVIVYNNAAGRILAVLKNVKANSAGNAKDGWARALGCNATVAAVMENLALLQKQVHLVMAYLLGADGSQEKANPAHQKFNITRLQRIEEVLNANQGNLREAFDAHRGTVEEADLVFLEFVAGQMPVEDVDIDDLTSLKNTFDQLFDDVEKMDDLPKPLRSWLMQLISSVQISISRYQIYGSDGLRKEFFQVIGQMHDHFVDIEQIKAAKPNVWERFNGALGRMETISQAALKLKGIACSGLKFIGLLPTEAT
jgi:hypothetical protein